MYILTHIPITIYITTHIPITIYFFSGKVVASFLCGSENTIFQTKLKNTTKKLSIL
jgi:hypothetical protein